MSCDNIVSEVVLLKHPDDVRQYSMPFAAFMEDDETILTKSVTSSPTGLTITDDTIVSQSVTMTIADGVRLKDYRVKVTITTSAGQTLVGIGILKVRDS